MYSEYCNIHLEIGELLKKDALSATELERLMSLRDRLSMMGRVLSRLY